MYHGKEIDKWGNLCVHEHSHADNLTKIFKYVIIGIRLEDYVQGLQLPSVSYTAYLCLAI